MEFAESSLPTLSPAPSSTGASALRVALRDGALVLEVDGAVSSVHGLSWLAAQRDRAAARRLEDLQLLAMAEGWRHTELARARLACLRPRRAEMLALGRAYLAALTPGASDAAHRMRRAGVEVELAGDVGVDALLGVASALGVTPSGIHAPRLRFDALGAYVGCDAGDRVTEAGRAARVYVGTRAGELLGDRPRDRFVRFTGVVAHEGPATWAQVSSFAELVELVTGR